MSVLSREATVDTFGQSDRRKGIRAGFSAVCAACLAVALFVPDGYPRLVAFSVLGLCSLASIVSVCHANDL